MKSMLRFALASVSLVVLAGLALSWLYQGDAERRAIWVSAVVALVVQLFAFAVVRLVPREHVVAGWGLGALLRFAVLGLYALVIVQAVGLPAAAATVSLALFFFLSTLVEPLFLRS
jgi:hypothetical protein